MPNQCKKQKQGAKLQGSGGGAAVAVVWRAEAPEVSAVSGKLLSKD